MMNTTRPFIRAGWLVVLALAMALVSCSSSEEPSGEPVRHALLENMVRDVHRISITTEGHQPIISKQTYVRGVLNIEGGDGRFDYDGPLDIRGRGNSTWTYGLREGKKPYRVRLPAAASLMGLPAERNWILLANYLDGTLMGNVIAFATAQLLEMPFTHNMIPVELEVNGEYMGSYLFTEHKEVKPHRIDIGDNGVLLELDTNFDEPFKFASDVFNLPVMVANPDLEGMTDVQAALALEQIRDDFTRFEEAVSAGDPDGDDLGRLLDRQSLAKFMVVFKLTANRELNHPKSVYMYSVDGGPYNMGPIWDFDWAYGYNPSRGQAFVNPNAELLLGGGYAGGEFFRALMLDPQVQSAFKEEWTAFYDGLFSTLLTYIEEYGSVIKESYERDYDRWHDKPEQFARVADFDAEVARIIDWMKARAAYINRVVAEM